MNFGSRGFKFLIAAIFLAFVFVAAWNYPERDEGYLVTDAAMFKSALLAGDLKATHVSTRTAVSLYWILLGADFIADEYDIVDIGLFRRLSIFAVRLGLLFAAYKLLVRLFDKRLAYVVSVYLLVNNLVFAGVVTTWLDKLVTMFGFLTIISWSLYVDRSKLRYGLASGVFLGLTILTKPVGLFWPFMMFVMFGVKRFRDIDYIKKALVVMLVGMLTFVIACPAMWVDPINAFFSRYGNDSGTLHLQLGGDGTNPWIFYPRQILLADSVLAMGVLLFLYESYQILVKKVKPNLSYRFALVGAVYLLIVFTISMILRDDDTGLGAFFSIRYLTPGVPLFTVYLMSRVMKMKKAWGRALILFTVFALNFNELLIVKQFLWLLITRNR